MIRQSAHVSGYSLKLCNFAPSFTAMILQLDSLYEPIFVQRQCPYGEALILALNIESIPVVFCCGSTQSSLWGGINSGTEDRIYNSHILLLIATPQQIAAPQNKSQCVLMPLQWGRLWIWPGYSGPAYLLCTMWYTYEDNENTNELPLPLAETSTGPTINFPQLTMSY